MSQLDEPAVMSTPDKAVMSQLHMQASRLHVQPCKRGVAVSEQQGEEARGEEARGEEARGEEEQANEEIQTREELESNSPKRATEVPRASEALAL